MTYCIYIFFFEGMTYCILKLLARLVPTTHTRLARKISSTSQAVVTHYFFSTGTNQTGPFRTLRVELSN